MPTPTHEELVRDEIVRQWDQRVDARARLRQRPLGHDEVSDKRARELWWKQNPAAAPQIAESQGLTPWQATKLLYPYREALLQAEQNRGGIKAVIKFVEKMNRQSGAEQAEEAPREDATSAY